MNTQTPALHRTIFRSSRTMALSYWLMTMVATSQAPLHLTAQRTVALLLSVGNGLIESRTDVDFFSFMNGGGDISINVNPAQFSPNLDILAELYEFKWCPDCQL